MAAPRARFVWWIVVVNAVVPLGVLAWEAERAGLGANPIELFLHATGTITLLTVLATLAITPARRLFDAPSLGKLRRLLGLVAFGYALIHLATYAAFDQLLQLDVIVADVWERPFIAAGMAAFFLMVPLAVTSTDGWIRRLGGTKWRKLHRRVYLLAILGVVHYFMLVKVDTTRPFIFAAVLAVLLGYRVVHALRQRRSGGQRE